MLSAPAGLEFLEARPLGGTHMLDGLWRRLGIDATMKRLLAGRRMDARAERTLFALVANRALAPSSKLAATEWISSDVHIDGLTVIDERPATGRWTGWPRSNPSWPRTCTSRSPIC